MKVVLYARVRNVNELDKLEEQKGILLQYAKRNNLEVVGSYSDIGFDRTGYSKMINNLENIDLILVTKVSRITRKYKEFYKFMDITRKANTQWYAIDEHYNSLSSEGRLFTSIMLEALENYEKSEGL